MRGNDRLPFVALSNFPMLQNVPDLEALPTSFQKGEEVKKILKQGFGRCLKLDFLQFLYSLNEFTKKSPIKLCYFVQ